MRTETRYAFLDAVPTVALGNLLKPHELHCLVLVGRAFRAAYERSLVARTTHDVARAFWELRSPARRAAWIKSLILRAPNAWHAERVGILGVFPPQDALGAVIRRGLSGLDAATVGTAEQAAALPARVRHLTWEHKLGLTGCDRDWEEEGEEEKEGEEEEERRDDDGDDGDAVVVKRSALPPHLESLVAAYIPYACWRSLPATLRRLTLQNPWAFCSSLSHNFDLRTLPCLQELRIAQFPTWPLEFAAHAPGLRVLHVRNCDSMSDLWPGSLPAGLESLALDEFHGTVHRGALPAGLRDLRLHGEAVLGFILPLACLPGNLCELDLHTADLRMEELSAEPDMLCRVPSRTSLRTVRLAKVVGYTSAFWPCVEALTSDYCCFHGIDALGIPCALADLDVPASAFTDIPATVSLSSLTALTLRKAQRFVFARPLPPKLRSLYFNGSVSSFAAVRSDTLTRLTLNCVFNGANMNVAQLFPSLQKLAFASTGGVSYPESRTELAWLAEFPRLASLKFEQVNLTKCGVDNRGYLLGPDIAPERMRAGVPVLPALRTLSLGQFALLVDPPLLAAVSPQIRRIPAGVTKFRIHSSLWPMCSADLRMRAQTVTVSQGMVCARFF